MTSPEPRRKRILGTLAFGGLVCGALLVGLSGCEDPPPPPPPAPAPPPPPPPAPKALPVSQLMSEMSIDSRVSLPETEAPNDTAQRRAILSFFDAFVRDNPSVIREMLAADDRAQLDALLASPEWADTVEQISRVDISTGTSPMGKLAVMGVFWVGSEFQPTLWEYSASVGGSTFESVITPPGILDRISGTDLITAWFEVIDQERAKAFEPDEPIIIEQEILDEDEQDQRDRQGPGPPGAPGPGPGPGPGGPGPGAPG